MVPSDDHHTALDYPQTLSNQCHVASELTEKKNIRNKTENITHDTDLLIEERAALIGLTENIRDQDDLERDITSKANLILIENEDKFDYKRLERIRTSIEKLEGQKITQKHRLDAVANNDLAQDRCIRVLEQIDHQIFELQKDLTDIQNRIEERNRHTCPENESKLCATNERMPTESQKEFLIRTGKITPFFQLSENTSEYQDKDLTKLILDVKENIGEQVSQISKMEQKSHKNLQVPGFSTLSTYEEEFSLRPRKKRRIYNSSDVSENYQQSPMENHIALESNKYDDEFSDSEEQTNIISKPPNCPQNESLINIMKEEKIDLTGVDDGNESIYQARLKSWVRKRRVARNKSNIKINNKNETKEDCAENNEKEWFEPCPNVPDYNLGNDLKLPGDIHPSLFDYQKTGIKWLGELYNQQVGGIIGDEMGLGKTIQVISFIASLHYSKKLTKPVIIITPATVLQQWVNEFHKWWPPIRISILHSSGSGMMNVRHENRLDNRQEIYTIAGKKRSSKNISKIVEQVIEHGHVLLTTYAGLQTYAHTLLPVEWGYAVLDEGHKIRNPNTAVTIYCKELKTSNRIIMSGTPMQNNLIELWSLFDFIFPMRLGTLVSFRQSFETPIKQGGYANSTNLQVMTATKCAEELKSVISPYLLQRLKVDVASDLPKKTEQVLFVKLTKQQRDAYEEFLASKDVSAIINGTRQSLYGIDILKKICNHPDLLDPRLKVKPGYIWADPNKSGKMKIVENLLNLWKGFGHKTLLFCQGVQMLDLLEHFIRGLDQFVYLRMDGNTNIRLRQNLVDKFNERPEINVFLLTTKVGGLGVNLTGANRVLIFDPDWNPSTDTQARERAWRLGQKKEVTIYRLITAGTIEEKMYHRQIFKQFLTNKVLKDPKQRQTFQMKDLYDLFTLGNIDDSTTETEKMFKGTELKLENVAEKSNSADEIKNLSELTSMSSEFQDSAAELCKMNGIVDIENYSGNLNEIKCTSEEDRLMKGIFSGRYIQSALEHDQIINGKRKITADRAILEREARRVAAGAAAHLSKAVEVAQNLVPGTVTWTGEFGSAGKPTDIRQFGSRKATYSSSNLKNRVKETGASINTSLESLKPKQDFKKFILSFIKRRGGSVQSEALVSHFNRICQTPQQTADFKIALGKVAQLEYNQHNKLKGKWYLKDEYK